MCVPQVRRKNVQTSPNCQWLGRHRSFQQPTYSSTFRRHRVIYQHLGLSLAPSYSKTLILTRLRPPFAVLQDVCFEYASTEVLKLFRVFIIAIAIVEIIFGKLPINTGTQIQRSVSTNSRNNTKSTELNIFLLYIKIMYIKHAVNAT